KMAIGRLRELVYDVPLNRIYYLRKSYSLTSAAAQSSSAVASLCISSWNLSSLAVESCSDSGKSSLAVGIPCAFYSQQSSPKLDAPAAIKFPK
nr:hypothetical protein [Tanacetum cinerariifolium]